MAMDAVANVLRPWIQEQNLAANEWNLEGGPTSRRFALRISGATGWASRKVLQALDTLRPQAAGAEWRKFEGLSVTGSRSEIFLGLDKNAKQIKTEQAVKTIKHIFN
eukprot:1715389-Pyramimonas_sp.AAC.1